MLSCYLLRFLVFLSTIAVVYFDYSFFHLCGNFWSWTLRRCWDAFEANSYPPPIKHNFVYFFLSIIFWSPRFSLPMYSTLCRVVYCICDYSIHFICQSWPLLCIYLISDLLRTHTFLRCSHITNTVQYLGRRALFLCLSWPYTK